MSTRKLSSIYNITRPPRSTPTFLAQVAAPARRTLALPAHLITHTSVLTAANLGALETKVGFSAFWNNQAYFKKNEGAMQIFIAYFNIYTKNIVMTWLHVFMFLQQWKCLFVHFLVCSVISIVDLSILKDFVFTFSKKLEWIFITHPSHF